MTESNAAVEAAYEEHSARLLALLVRIFGTQNLDMAEDLL
jgi:DNA-directed RNA polymerase specialized sigma24 family protein